MSFIIHHAVFAPPNFPDDVERTHAARILNSLLVPIFITTCIAMFVLIPLVEHKLLMLAISSLALGVQIFVRMLSHRGHVRLATILYIIFVWMTVTAMVIFTSRVLSPISIHYVSIIVLAGLVLGRRTAIGLIIFTSLVVIGINMIETVINGSSPIIVQSTASWFYFPVGLVTAYLPVNVAIRNLQESLDHSRRVLDEHGKTQVALQHSEARFAAVFNQALDGIVQLEDNIIVVANPAFAAMLDYAPEELVGQHINQFVTPQYRNLILERTVARARGEAIPNFYEAVMIRRDDNSEIPVEVSTGAILHNTHTTVVSVVRNIARRKEAEDAVHKLNTDLKQHMSHLTVLNDIGRTISTLSDLKSVLRNMLEQFQTIMQLDVFFVILHDADAPLIQFLILYDSGQFWEAETQAVSLHPDSYTLKVVQSGKPLLINLTKAEVQQSPNQPTMVGDKQRVSASVLMAPLTIGDRIIGAISIQSYTLNAYDEAHCALLMGAAYQVAIAIENARLYDEVRKELAERKQAQAEVLQLNAELQEQTARLLLLNDIGHEVTRLSGLDATLRNILEQLKSIIALDAFIVILYDAETNMLTYPITYDVGQFWTHPPEPMADTDWIAKFMRDRHPVLVNRTAQTLAEISTTKHFMLGDVNRISASFVTVPLPVQDRIIGTVSIQSYTLNAYNENHVSLMMGAAYHIAVAVENARLYDELRKELSERKQAEETVNQLNIELEERVKQRTAQLLTANRELEAFSYSVSHDLRAPLRALNGFASIIAEDLGDTASDDIRYYLERIQYNAARLGKLIDDLLNLSRLGRAEIHITQVDMGQVVQQVLDDLQYDPHFERATIVVGDLPPCQGDVGLLTQVWVNLIANAIKYSRNCEYPRIEIQASTTDGQMEYRVADNGAGFDMQYVDKLFGVFQRLHKTVDFEGTGIGLATVKRIIERHGGSIRAEGVENNGATFYFTVGQME